MDGVPFIMMGPVHAVVDGVPRPVFWILPPTRVIGPPQEGE